MTQDRPNLPLDEIVERCLEEIVSGRLTAEEALARWPDQREDLAPLLDLALAMRELPPVPERAPDPDRRAAFMTALATTPQEPPRDTPAEADAGGSARRVGWPGRIVDWLGGFVGSAPRIAAVAGPAAAIALVAVFVMFTNGADRASAATLTIFDGAVERLDDGAWRPVADGAALEEGSHLRTTADGIALITFADGSTAALDPATDLVLERIASGDTRRTTLNQLAGRLWHDVAPGAAEAGYVVHTPDATVEAHGTTFGTTVDTAATEVTTAAGEVAVAAGSDRVTVEPGLTLRAAAQRIVDTTPHPAVDRPTTLRVDGPFVASLQSRAGAATGALPSGVLFQQIPGVSTTNPGDGPQLLRFYDIAPGRYTLVLRRIPSSDSASTDGPVPDGASLDGTATLETNGRRRTVDLPANLETLRLQIDIAIDRSTGAASLTLVDRTATSVEPPIRDERIVDTPRTTDAIPVSDRRATLATPSDAAPSRPTPTPTETDRTPSPTLSPEPTRTTTDAQPTVTATPATDTPPSDATSTATPPPTDRTSTATPTETPTRDTR